MNLIYGLTCPTTGDVRYIGKTKNPSKRLGSHMAAARHGARHRNAQWLLSLDRNGLLPGFIVLHRATEFSWQTMECFFIASARHIGLRLTNGTDGGEGVAIAPDEIERVKLLRKQGFTKEVKEKMSRSIREAFQRDDIKQRLVDAMKAHAAKPEHRARLAEIARLPRSEEAKARQQAGREAYWARRAAAKAIASG